MAQQAILIPHGNDRPEERRRAAPELQDLGIRLVWRHVDQVHWIEPPDESVAITFIYGGSEPEGPNDRFSDRYPNLKNGIGWGELSTAHRASARGK